MRAAFLLALAPTLAIAQSPTVLPYQNAALPVAARVTDLIGRMTLPEKFWQLFMIPGDRRDTTHDYSRGIFGLQVQEVADPRADAEQIAALQRYFRTGTRLGIPIIPFDEALHGLRRPGATMFPQAIALAATWDTALMERVSAAVARETRSRGIRQVLSPVINIATDVRWGRVEETYGEDPFLTSAMARAFVAPFEAAGVIATPKHFVANVGDGGRDSYPIALDERTLTEVHFPPFRAALAAGARSVMTAYNSVGGVPATQNQFLLSDILKSRWGFGGFVISDAAATGGATVLHMTEPTTPVAAQHAIEAGLDVIFQSSWPQHRPYLDAFTRGLIPRAQIDSAVARVLRVKFALGLFDTVDVDAASAAHWNGHPDHMSLARDAAAASLVLLRNQENLLPLASTVSTVAIIGVDAVEARLGGYSSAGVSPISIWAGMQARLGAHASYAPGPGRRDLGHHPVPPGRLDVQAQFFAGIVPRGTPVAEQRDSVIDARWTFDAPVRGLSNDWFSVHWFGSLTIGPDAVRRLGVEGSDGWRLYLDGKLLIDRWRKESAGAHLADVSLLPGSQHAIRLEFFETTGNARVRLIWDTGDAAQARARLDSAVALARGSEVAIVVAGIEEGEFQDRSRLGLPGDQEQLIRAVAATGTPTVVVLIGGSAITMPWLEDVDAVVMAWYPGQQGGSAIAEMLFGESNPAGRLPITFPVSEGQLPLVYNHKPTGRGDDYIDLSGQPLFPFGHGLSYTTFEYSSLTLTPSDIPPEGTTSVRVTVRNSGERAGDEVVQLYLRDELASMAQPVIKLGGFRRIHLAPGESRQVEFTLTADQLGVLDRDMRWVVEPGTFRIYVGGSSRDIRQRGVLTVQ